MTNLNLARVETVSYSPEQTQEIGRTLGVGAQKGFIYLLSGELGSGKTCLTQGMLAGLDSEEHARSPSFILVTQYSGRLTMYHMDLYRMEDIESVFDLGLEDYLFGDGLSVVEWADKARNYLPAESLNVQIERIDETERRLTLATSCENYLPLIKVIATEFALDS